MRLGVVVALAACGGGVREGLTTEEVELGQCPRGELKPGESCRVGARDYSAGATAGLPHGDATAWFRWPLFDAELDERLLRHGGATYRSLAGGIGTHLRPMIFWPDVQRYLDPVVDVGADLGALYRDSHIDGRADAYAGAALDVYAPDFGPFRYTDTGVPGLRVGVRVTGYALGWETEVAFEVGLIWRWGVPIELYRHWTTWRTGD